jgi:hypothetical protein
VTADRGKRLGFTATAKKTIRDHPPIALPRQTGVDRRYDVRKQRHRRVRPVLVALLATLGLTVAAAPPVQADVKVSNAAAFALFVDADLLLGAVPLHIDPVAKLRISGDVGDRYENVAKIELPPLLEALLLATGARTQLGHDGLSKASARVATIKLKLMGELLIKLLKSECRVTANEIEMSSEVLFADGSLLGIAINGLSVAAQEPNTQIVIPLVGKIILNEQKREEARSGRSGRIRVTVNALRIELDGLLGYGNIIVSQSMCKVRGPDVLKNGVTVKSTTNGRDTTADLLKGDPLDGIGNGLLGGLLGGGDPTDLLDNAPDLLGGGLGGIL